MDVNLNNKNLDTLIRNSLLKLQKEKIVERIWQKDYTVWSEKPDEISNRLGWLDCPSKYQSSINDIESFVREVKEEGFTNALLLGMGGSSLSPEVFRFTFGVKDGFPELSVLDSTHPGAIMELENKLETDKTLFIVSTKSGGTVETMSFMKYFFTKAVNDLGKEKAGNQFVAITDPGSGLEKLAKKLNFRKIFLNDPDIGGRYSALSLFGLVPAALIGVKINKILSLAQTEAELCKMPFHKNTAAQLGVIIGILADEGIDKLTFITSPQIKYFGAWIEQLIAESTGKNGKGILPVDLEEVLPPFYYSKDRLFVYLKLKSDSNYKNQVEKLIEAQFPVITIELKDVYDLGREYFRWEFATAVAGCVPGIQPFDQPNVESAKAVAKKLMNQFKKSGKLPLLTSNFTEAGIAVSGDFKSDNLKDAINEFLQSANEEKSYVAIQAYLKPTVQTTSYLYSIRTAIQKKYKSAVTVGYGPRFLHSTGQLHKGDAGNGLFIQIIDEPESDILIPDEPGSNESSISYGVLIIAQAMGDREALINNNRKVITIDIGNKGSESLELILNKISS